MLMLNHPTGLFSGDYNSALRGCWPLKFLHTLQLPRMYFKSYLGCRVASCWALPHISSYFLTRHRISELRLPIAVKLCTVSSICVNFLMQVQKLGGPPIKIFTPAKFSVDFTQLSTLIANISGTRPHIKNRKDM